MDRDTLTLIGNIAICLSSPIITIVFGLAGRSILRSKGYSGWVGFALGAVFGILGLIIAFVLPDKTPRFSSQVLRSPPIRTTSSSYNYNDSDDSSDRDDYLRGMQQLWKEESREAEERERRESEEAARDRYEERERYKQEERNDYYAQKEQERIDRLYEEYDERLRSKYGWSDDE